MPLQRRLPKRGFRSLAPLRYAIVNVGELERFAAGSTVDAAVLAAAGLVRPGRPVKLLADGALSRQLTIRVDKASAAARARVEAAGGMLEAGEVAAASPVPASASGPDGEEG